MDAFLRNVPQDLTDQSLRVELEPRMKALGIGEWTCSKPRRKPIAWIFFPNPSHGHKFLENHGKIPKGPSTSNGKGATTQNGSQKDGKLSPNGPNQPTPKGHIARLFITGSPVYVEKSHRSVGKPDPGYSLPKKPETQNARIPTSKSSALTFSIVNIACGKNVFIGPSDTLTFAQQTQTSIACTGKLTRRMMSVVASEKFRMDFPLSIIQDFITGDTNSITLVLGEPPRIFAMVNDIERPILKWERSPSCPHWPDHGKYNAHCLVYHFNIAIQDFGAMVQEIRRRDLISVTPFTLPIDKSPQPQLHDYQSSMRTFEGRIHAAGSRSKLVPFPLLFQVQALVMNNYLAPSSGTAIVHILEKKAALLGQYQTRSSTLFVTVDSMKKLFHEIPYPTPGTEPADIDPAKLIADAEQMERELRTDDPFRDRVYGATIPDHQAWVMKAMITPTRVVLHGPEPESRNRILRKYSNHTDYFIRCLFCDDDGQDLSFNPKVSNDLVYERYRSVLRNGIQVAGRKYSFLGFSHSSLRSHSAWFVAPFIDSNMQHQDYDTIIRSLGNFDGIRVPAKCAARIGQAFSETPYAVPIVGLDIMSRHIPDVKSRDGSRVFSDGVGTISYEAMRECWAYLPQRSKAATCFQVRCGGVKGMLSLDTRLKGKIFCIRQESMMKFESLDMEELGICDSASRPLRLMLNRQMIKILEDMGTSDSWFLKLQSEELKFIRGVTAKASNTSTFLRYQLIGTNVGLPQFIRHVDDMGIDYRQDVFLRTVVEHVVLRELRLMKHKARIPVKKGVTLFGIMDETGFLDPDEIYVTFDKAADMEQPPRKSMAVITRSPALHPGDIRFVTMVTPPETSPLRHLRNCVVFSQHGQRDLPSQLSGGDLDGDLYNIIWDHEALPKREFSPADYPRVDPQQLSRPVTRDDIADFFINFMKTDILGMIATRHQILADVKVDGTYDPECIKLAELHSTAVDSSKTGLPVEIKELPRGPRTRPDFLAPAPPLVTYDIGQIAHIGEIEDTAAEDDDDMGGAKHQYHKSNKILGKLYRSVDEKKIWVEDISRAVNSHMPNMWQEFLELMEARIRSADIDINPTRQLEHAWRIRRHYDSAITDMQWQFSENPRKPITEVEVFCGSILNSRGSQTRRQRDSSIKLREEMDRVMTWITNMIRGRPDHESQAGVVERCLACVRVGCVKDTGALNSYGGGGRLQSFKVLSACCLLKEMNGLQAEDLESVGGGYVGVSGRQQRQVVLPLR